MQLKRTQKLTEILLPIKKALLALFYMLPIYPALRGILSFNVFFYVCSIYVSVNITGDKKWNTISRFCGLVEVDFDGILFYERRLNLGHMIVLFRYPLQGTPTLILCWLLGYVLWGRVWFQITEFHLSHNLVLFPFFFICPYIWKRFVFPSIKLPSIN